MITHYYFLFKDGKVGLFSLPLWSMKFEKHKMGIICIGFK